MPRIRFHGPLSLRLASAFALMRIGTAVTLAHRRGQPLAPDWDRDTEVGVRFWRHQFTQAMRAIDAGDPARGRAILDSLQTETDDVYDVRAEGARGGTWLHPKVRQGRAVVLYLHGGGYAFHGRMSHRFARMLAHRLEAPVYAPDYRLTPGHPHPAQAEDALAAWGRVCEGVDPSRIVLIGDSAGGHMVLMLMQALRARGLAQPALAVGLCPWTDIGARGDSLTGNDAFDLVQGWMAVQFGRWLDPGDRFGRAALSPIAQDYSGLAPLYLQAGGREVLRDMIDEFAQGQADKGADLLFDLWPGMPHDFQLYDSTQAASREALERLRQAVRASVDGGPSLRAGPRTRVASGRFALGYQSA
ncbi:MAG: alpha/beta hydrolase fold domain-containing protein [Rhodobacter sp.]|nr:alpha/beta hydrolase fold domain-containing protein [Paracoccaceae bacterium]MCC0075538.1 alpha/beta hydrolase fold domain-containing protein [Rhodobacter sp.]